MVIVETTVFTKQVQKLFTDEEYRQFQADLISRPDKGAVIPRSGGLRKIRWGYRGKGKRGGVRVIYYWVVKRDRVLMLYMYPKNVQGNLSPSHLKALTKMVKAEYL